MIKRKKEPKTKKVSTRMCFHWGKTPHFENLTPTLFVSHLEVVSSFILSSSFSFSASWE
jgi:hypothetical protein